MKKAQRNESKVKTGKTRRSGRSRLVSSCGPRGAAAAGVTPRMVAQSRGKVPNEARDDAASDDACGTTVAGAALTAAACSDRGAYAEVAPAGAGRLPRKTEMAQKTKDKTRDKVQDKAQERFAASTGRKPAAELASDAAGFAEEMHSLVNFYGIAKRLLESGDEKVAQRTWERLMEMQYGRGAGTASDEPLQINLGDLAKPDGQV